MNQMKKRKATVPCEKSAIESELSTFMALERLASDGKVLQWWQSNESTLPNLYLVVKKNFCIPASAERSFSTAGNCVIPLRTSITTDNLERIVFFKKIKIC